MVSVGTTTLVGIMGIGSKGKTIDHEGLDFQMRNSFVTQGERERTLRLSYTSGQPG